MKSILKVSIISILLSVNTAYAKEPKWMVGAATLEYVLYIDVNSIVVEKDSTRVWILTDMPFSKWQKKKNIIKDKHYSSSISINNIFCNESTYTVNQIYFYSDNKGKGDLVYTSPYDNNPSNKDSIPPGTLLDMLKDKVCFNR
jgi:hypothetical protein